MDVGDVTSLLSSSGGGPSSAATATEGLGSQDFLKLLITQLTNQDPLEPTSNDELLRQISSIREIELSTTLTDSLRSLTGQQKFASASALIGQYVTGAPGESGEARQGVVVGVRFTGSGQAMLQLSDGAEMALDSVSTIQSPLQAGQAMVGLNVIGVDRREHADPKPVDGVVTTARQGEAGETILELDSGDSLRLRDVIAAAQQQAA